MSSLEQEISGLLSDLGFELVTFERAGGSRRPLLRVRIDRVGDPPDETNVTIDDCARVSRKLGRYLDERAELPEQSIVEVSSPGVERPSSSRPTTRGSPVGRCLSRASHRW